ncbi:Brix domain containing protein [Pyrodictium occultum]|uniref:Probable Brix domain-containing ribosomal biogenesis protein n=1 Tax=Pyrodictium occultum TaxID=2309 RepID=A0A0V8RX36_PYROC|nr:Brix domain containing protein [Pyrodictium occultum]
MLVTTSHRPTQRVRSFVKDLVSVLPGAERLTRGKATLRDLYYEAAARGAKRVIVVSVWKGNPGTVNVYQPLEPPEMELRLMARILLRGVRLSRETPGAQRAYGARSLGVHVAPSAGQALHSLADLLSRAFLARVALDYEEALARFDVVAVVREGSRSLAEVEFRCSTGRACGPLLRIAGVVDYDTGVRLHKAEGALGEAGQSPG